MITKRRCPHTGVLNFYENAELGSVSTGAKPGHYIWRSYLDDPKAGVARKLSIAEAHLRDAIARATQPRGLDLNSGLFALQRTNIAPQYCGSFLNSHYFS